MQQMQKNKKVCLGCNFVCFQIEDICPRCGAYNFRNITSDEEKLIPIEDKKLDLDSFL
jgi:RNA polymerase subunit RPABC4/transcription elongation factor Spt4